MMGIIKKEIWKEKEQLLIKIILFLQVILKMGKRMDLVFINIVMEKFLKENIKKEKNMAKEK